MQAQDGHMVGLPEVTAKEFLEHGNLDIVTVGEVFRVGRCYFEIEKISPYGITAKGISSREYFDKRNPTVLKKEQATE